MEIELHDLKTPLISRSLKKAQTGHEFVEVNGIWDDELSDIVGVVGDYIINIEESRNHEVEDWVHVRMS